MQDIVIEEKETPEKILHELTYVNYGYVNRQLLIEKVLGRRPQSICLNDTAQSRLSNIVGFIYGISLHDKTEAVAMFLDIRRNLDYLDRSNMLIDEADEYKRKYPDGLVIMSDDGTFNGFSFYTYHAVKRDMELPYKEQTMDGISTETLTKDFEYYGHIPYNMYYKRSYNGGLLYHGPAAGEVFAVNLNPVRYWSTHT